MHWYRYENFHSTQQFLSFQLWCEIKQKDRVVIHRERNITMTWSPFSTLLIIASLMLHLFSLHISASTIKGRSWKVVRMVNTRRNRVGQWMLFSLSILWNDVVVMDLSQMLESLFLVDLGFMEEILVLLGRNWNKSRLGRTCIRRCWIN